jgi:hypothetical protein
MARFLALVIMLAGTLALAWLAGQLFGLVGGVITGVFGLLVTASTLRL